MRELILEDNSLKHFENKSNYPLKICNLNSNITSINVMTKEPTILNGIYNCKLNFINSCYISLDSNFKLKNNEINLINNTTCKGNLKLSGNLNSLKENLIINCYENICAEICISCKNTTKSIDFYCKSKDFSNNLFEIKPLALDTCNDIQIPINLYAPKNGILKVYTDLNFIDFKDSKNLVLEIFPNVTINRFLNIDSTTFQSISAPLRIIEDLNNEQFDLPISSLFYEVQITNGIGTLDIPIMFKSKNNLKASVILENKEYSIPIIP